MNIGRLLEWIKEREAIRLRREAGVPPPWTDDPIFRHWNFCNVRREHDRITRWIATNWRDSHADDPDLWFAMTVARLINWPDTMAELGYPVPWNREHFLSVPRARGARGDKVWGDAYNISNGGKSEPKVEHVAGVLDPMWARRERLRPKPDDSLLGWHARLMQHDGMGSFMAAQVVADMKYVPPLIEARDWMTFAASGPGSRRGLNRILGRPVKASWREDDWRAAIRKLHAYMTPELQRIGIEQLHAQDLQNCLCEFDKMERVRLNEGKPKRRFISGETSNAVSGRLSSGRGLKTKAAPSSSRHEIIHAAAIAYAASGLPVFPCKSSDKRPLVRGGFKSATTDASVINVWWRRWPDALIGVPTGKGFDVLDLDVKDGRDGFTAVPDWQRLSPIIARTRSGGAHLYFRTDGTVRCTSNKIAAGVDTRGVGGYVIVPPSTGYTWLHGEPDFTALPPWPSKLRLPKIGDSAENNGATTNTISAVAKKYAGEGLPPSERADIEKIEAALAVIPADNYDTWFRVGAALQNELGDGGFSLFKRWSKKSAKYDPEECKVKWQEVAPITDINVGTIFRFADQADSGWRARHEQKAGGEQPKADTKKPYGSRASAAGIVIVRASEIKMRSKNWLWEGHLLRGAQELLTGIPGLGKSQVQMSYVASVTNRVPWPDGTVMEPHNVVMLTAEDKLEDEIIPRLVAAGADLDRVHILKYIKVDKKRRQFLLSEDLEQLGRDVARIGDVALVTLDPITAYMGGKMDSHKATEVRSQLGPLKDFAERTNVAVSTITHPAKSTNNQAINHFIGSQAFIAAARVGHICVEEVEEDEDGNKQPTGRILFAHAKHNASIKMPTLAYTIKEIIVGVDEQTGATIAAPHVAWEAEPVDITADQAVAAAAHGRGGGGRRQDAQRAAMKFLEDFLKAGPVEQKKVEAAASKRGFSAKQLRTARELLQVVTEKSGFEGAWTWRIPTESELPF